MAGTVGAIKHKNQKPYLESTGSAFRKLSEVEFGRITPSTGADALFCLLESRRKRSANHAIMHDLSYFREHLDVFAAMAKRRNITLDLTGSRARQGPPRTDHCERASQGQRNKASD